MALLEIIVLAAIATAIGFKLFTTFGQEDDDDIFNNNPQNSKTNNKENDKKIIDIYEKRKSILNNIKNKQNKDITTLGNDEKLSEDQKIIKPILEKYPYFSLTSFYRGARAAYEFILEKFAEGNKNELKKLMSKEIFELFSSNIDDKPKDQVHELTFVTNPKIEIINAKLKNKCVAEITVRITSDQLNLLKDKDGKELPNSPKSIDKIIDTWVFSKDMTSSDPTWLLTDII